MIAINCRFLHDAAQWFFSVVLWPLCHGAKLLFVVCGLVVCVVCSRTEPKDQMTKCCPLVRFARWHDMLMDASPTFLEHTNMALRATKPREAWRKVRLSFHPPPIAFHIDIVEKTRALDKLWSEELVEMLNKGCSVIKCTFLTVLLKLMFRNG